MEPGDLLTASIVFNPPRVYYMVITSKNTGQTITTSYQILRGQQAPEQTAYFVLEHQPEHCDAYPTSGVVTFTNISMAVDNQLVASPKWSALQEHPACSSKATIMDAETIQFSWDAKGESLGMPHGSGPAKWLNTRKPI